MQDAISHSTFLPSQKISFRNIKNKPNNISRTAVLISIFLYVTFFSSLSAQVKITGKLVHKDKSPIEFAEVILLNKDSMGVLSELANEDGSFLLNAKQGSYTLQVRQFKTLFYKKQIDATTDLNLGIIEIENFSQELNTINIEVKDKLIERKVDRVVFNVENSLRAVGGDALEALSVTPGVRVQNDKLSMIGKSSLAVMV
ncbi:MAG: carboxypeptidase-like regulatory domain-containing protein, partial [Bacteroidia bacterium]